MFQLQMTVPGHVYIDHLNIRFRPAHVILPRQGTTDFPVTAFIVDCIDRKRRLLFLIEELEQLPVPYEMWDETLGDETFVTIVRPRSEEKTSERQSLTRMSYAAVVCT